MTRMDLVPGQMAKMGIEAGHSMTPVMNRDESIREWERRQQQQMQSNGGQSSQQTKQQRSDYQHLDLLQQQADASQAMYASPPAQQNWSQAPNAAQSYTTMNRMQASTTSPPSFSVIVDAQQQQQQQQLRHQSPASLHMQQSIGSPSRGLSSVTSTTAPPTTYSSPNHAGGNSRYQPVGGSTPSLAAFDPYSPDVAQMMPSLQPSQYQGSHPPPSGQPHPPAGTNNVQRLTMMPQYSSALYAGNPTSPTSPMHRSSEEGQYSPISTQSAYLHSQMPTAPPGGRARYG